MALKVYTEMQEGTCIIILIIHQIFKKFYFILFIYLFLASPHGMRDLSSPIRDQTRAP